MFCILATKLTPIGRKLTRLPIILSFIKKATATSADLLKLVKIQPIDAHDTHANVIGDNDRNGYEDGGDYFICRDPTTGETVYKQSDSTTRWNAEIQVAGEGKSRELAVIVIQMTNGDTFVSDSLNNGTLDNLNIVSVKLRDPVGTNFSGFFDYQSVDGTRIVCFTQDVPIKTPHGEITARALQVGDLVETLDNGPQPVRWIGKVRVSEPDFQRNPKIRPVRIGKGALGGGLPSCDILVSRQHRMLVRSEIAQRLFNTNEILIPAIKLVGLSGIEIAEEITEIT